MRKHLRFVSVYTVGFCAVLMVLLFYCASLYATRQMHVEAREGRAPFRHVVAYWEDQIRVYGAQKAHADFVQVGEGLKESSGHALAHAFGQALYQSGDAEGASVCGDEFLAGCFHQYVGEVLADEGFSRLPSLLESCIQNTHMKGAHFSCEHGIGHGVLGFLGYEIAELVKALDTCDTFGIPYYWNGCFDGAFMEYYSLELVSKDALRDPRPFALDQRYEPCLRLSQRYQRTCARELVSWWHHVLKERPEWSKESEIKTTTEWCQGMQSRALRNYCFIGIGHFVAKFAAASGSPRDIALWCASNTADATDRLQCIGEAARMYNANTAQDVSVCAQIDGLTVRERAFCDAKLQSSREELDALNEQVLK